MEVYMDYSIFKECILEALTERFGDDCKIEYKEVLKNNGIRLDGLLVRFNNKSISPTVYVNDYYDRYVAGEDIDEIADHIAWLIKNNCLEDDFNPESLILFENIKDRIVYKLVNYEKNKDLLNTIPHKKFLDLAVVYYIAIKEDIFESASILINNSHLELWDKTMEDIDKEISMKYSKYNLVYVIPAGAVFNIVKTVTGIKVTIYTLNKWFGLDKDDSWEVYIPESIPEYLFNGIGDTEEDQEFNEDDFDFDIEELFSSLDDSDSGEDK